MIKENVYDFVAINLGKSYVAHLSLYAQCRYFRLSFLVLSFAFFQEIVKSIGINVKFGEQPPQSECFFVFRDELVNLYFISLAKNAAAFF